MEPFVVARRGTLLMPSGPAHDPSRMHLQIILTDPQPHEANQLLLVSVVTLRADRFFDPACVLEVGDHPWLMHESWVNYATCRQIDHERVVSAVTSGEFIPKEPVDDLVFQRVVAGLGYSEHVKPFVRRFIAGVKAS